MSTSAPYDFDVSSYPALPKAGGVFVAGTDTGVGKTLIAGAIARCLWRAGVGVEVFKPVASGCRREGGRLVSRDAEFLAACAESRRPPEEIVPVRLAEPLAPNVAAARAGVAVDLPAIFAAYGRLAQGPGRAIVVEGVGGLLCPITDEFWVVHLAKMMRLPLVIVARAGLGTINHTLLTVHAARSAGLAVAGVIVNRYDPGAVDISIQTNPGQIAARGNVPVLALVGDDPESSVEDVRLGPAVLDAVARVDWRRIAEFKGQIPK
jgi:dethiobiotin synthetase